jgi:hypothetical protein
VTYPVAVLLGCPGQTAKLLRGETPVGDRHPLHVLLRLALSVNAHKGPAGAELVVGDLPLPQAQKLSLQITDGHGDRSLNNTAFTLLPLVITLLSVHSVGNRKQPPVAFGGGCLKNVKVC